MKRSKAIEKALDDLRRARLPYPLHKQVQFHSKQSVNFHIDTYRRKTEQFQTAREIAEDLDCTIKAVEKRIEKIRTYLVWHVNGQTDMPLNRDALIDAAIKLLERGLSDKTVSRVLLAKKATDEALNILRKGT